MLVYSPNKIIKLRETRGWNQSELARRAGLSGPSVWALEKGETGMPKFETLRAIAAALGVPIQAILSDEQPADTEDKLRAATAQLSPANKAALLAAAEALVQSQKND